MATIVLEKKPAVRIFSVLQFISPSRWYLNSLLRHYLVQTSAESFLDVGAGQLRNYLLFPDGYTGLALSRKQLWAGVRRNHHWITKAATPPSLFEWDCNKDFSFFGPFCFCACTATLLYLEDRLKSVQWMANTLKKGGSLLFDTPDKQAGASIASEISHDFENVYIIHYAHKELPHEPSQILTDVLGYERAEDVHTSDLTEDDISTLYGLAQREMRSDAAPDENTQMCVFAQNKLTEYAETPAPPFKLVKGVWCLDDT